MKLSTPVLAMTIATVASFVAARDEDIRLRRERHVGSERGGGGRRKNERVKNERRLGRGSKKGGTLSKKASKKGKKGSKKAKKGSKKAKKGSKKAKKGSSLLDVYASHFATARYIDLTHTIGPSTNVWRGFGPSETRAGTCATAIPGFSEVGEPFTFTKHGFVTTAYNLVTDQLGTQLDPPSHWNEFGATMDVIPATVAIRPLVVVDITSSVKSDFGYAAQISDVEAWEAEHGTIPAGSVVFFRSGWSLGWEGYKTNGVPFPFPGVARDTLIFLHEQRNILFHGHEPLDTDATPNLEGEAWLMHHHYLQAEGVANLHLVPEHGCLVSIGFAKPEGGTGGYARYVAICPPDATDKGVTIDEAPGAPLPSVDDPLRRGSDGVLRPTPGAVPTEYCRLPEGVAALGCVDGTPGWLDV